MNMNNTLNVVNFVDNLSNSHVTMWATGDETSVVLGSELFREPDFEHGISLCIYDSAESPIYFSLLIKEHGESRKWDWFNPKTIKNDRLLCSVKDGEYFKTICYSAEYDELKNLVNTMHAMIVG